MRYLYKNLSARQTKTCETCSVYVFCLEAVLLRCSPAPEQLHQLQRQGQDLPYRSRSRTISERTHSIAYQDRFVKV